ncbi:unnamed protein product, partial [Porites evermanni]
MTTQQFGTLEPLDGADFTDYSERLNAYFIAHNIGQVAADTSEAAKREADKKIVAVTISMIGKTAYSTLKDLCLPDLPADKTYDQLTQILKDYYKPKVLEVAETYRFHHTVQSETESVAEYANKLKRLAVNCNFGLYLTRALRDQFVGGVRSQTTKKKLLSCDGTFDQALKVAFFREDKLILGELLGSGAFGKVIKAEAIGINNFNPRDKSQRKSQRRPKMFRQHRAGHAYHDPRGSAYTKTTIAVKTVKGNVSS